MVVASLVQNAGSQKKASLHRPRPTGARGGGWAQAARSSPGLGPAVTGFRRFRGFRVEAFFFGWGGGGGG